MLRMGFEETSSLVENPIAGLWALPLPKTLKVACDAGKISDAAAIRTAVARGKVLEAKSSSVQLATRPMSGDFFASIVLYTGNSIYRELNQALRQQHAAVPKFLPYLRLLFEATGCMRTRQVTLWRGIAANLYDEYAVGAEITWWSVSSCTADESVARNFMSQLGGKATLITLQTTSAIDITPLSIYENEKESLLMPGTRFKVRGGHLRTPG